MTDIQNEIPNTGSKKNPWVSPLIQDLDINLIKQSEEEWLKALEGMDANTFKLNYSGVTS